MITLPPPEPCAHCGEPVLEMTVHTADGRPFSGRFRLYVDQVPGPDAVYVAFASHPPVLCHSYRNHRERWAAT